MVSTLPASLTLVRIFSRGYKLIKGYDNCFLVYRIKYPARGFNRGFKLIKRYDNRFFGLENKKFSPWFQPWV